MTGPEHRVTSAMRLNRTELRREHHHLMPMAPCIFRTADGRLHVRGSGAYDYLHPDIRDTLDVGLTVEALEPEGFAARCYLEATP